MPLPARIWDVWQHDAIGARLRMSGWADDAGVTAAGESAHTHLTRIGDIDFSDAYAKDADAAAATGPGPWEHDYS